MMSEDGGDDFPVLDTAQLNRIESVHRGFLYQHLYAVGCLLSAQQARVEKISVERDEDIELAVANDRLYIQVKTRRHELTPADIGSAVERFDAIRAEHSAGKRPGQAQFYVVANAEPSAKLASNIESGLYAADVKFLTPLSGTASSALPPAWSTVSDAVTWCVDKAKELNFSLLAPETLVWKLASLMQVASAGERLSKSHTFEIGELPFLFEQALVQLQAFPTPPPNYRPLKSEPAFISSGRVRIICGFSGAGKTSWASQASLHSAARCAYYDVGDVPGPAVASALVRELGAKLIAKDSDAFRRVLMPGASGLEALTTLDSYLADQNIDALVVLDNAHRLPASGLADVVRSTKHLRLLMLCQPNENLNTFEALTSLRREALQGWDIDSIAAEVDQAGCKGTATAFEELRRFTAGMPLYVQSAIRIARDEYSGEIDQLCASLSQQTATVETAQEVILVHLFESFPEPSKRAISVFSLSDVGLTQNELHDLLAAVLGFTPQACAAAVKRMRSVGIIDIVDGTSYKLHDAFRTLGLNYLELCGEEAKEKALQSLKDLLIKSLEVKPDIPRLSILTQIYVKLNDVKTLIALSGEELFFEMGVTTDIIASLKAAAYSESVPPDQRFWALDGLIFSALKTGKLDQLDSLTADLEKLLTEHSFGYLEEMAYAMKMIIARADRGEAEKVHTLYERFAQKIPDLEQKRIFDYNFAVALLKLKQYPPCENIARRVIDSYYDEIGITPGDVLGKNPKELWTIIRQPVHVQEHLKHLADALELYALALERQHKRTPFIRVHSMKFYNMVNAHDSMVRVGQDLADEFVAIPDYVGARQVMEEHVLPIIHQIGLISKQVQARSQYAVILAYCQDYVGALDEMHRLKPYLPGLTADQRSELEGQVRLISDIQAKAQLFHESRNLIKVGRNDPCPCGSPLKYKKCHGS